MNEEWRDIEGYEGIYQISSYGGVRSFKFNKTRILKPGIDTAGYEQVDLYKDRKRDTQRVHRLVAEAFICNPDNLPFINHKDECKTNNIMDYYRYHELYRLLYKLQAKLRKEGLL